MFRIGERVTNGRDGRRKPKWKTPSFDTASAVHIDGRASATPMRHVPPSAARVSSLTEAMGKLTTKDPSTPERKPRRRATRLHREGNWVCQTPTVPKCRERSDESLLEEDIRFTCGENGSKHPRRRNRTPKKYVIVVDGTTDCYPTFVLQREKPESRPSPRVKPEPSEGMAAQLLEEYTRRAELLKSKGNEALRNGEYSKAQDLYSDGLRMVMGSYPGCKQLVSKLLSNRAATFIYQSDLKSALQDCEEARRIHPKNIRAYTRTATCYTSQGRFHDAKGILEQALEMLSASDPQFQSAKEQLTQNERLKTCLDDLAEQCAAGNVEEDVLEMVRDLCENVKYCERVWRLSVFVYLQSNELENLHLSIEKAHDIFKIDSDSEGGQVCWWQWIHVEAAWWDPRQPLESVIAEIAALLDAMHAKDIEELETTPETDNLTTEALELITDQLLEASALKDDGNQAVAQKNYDSAYELYTQAIQACEASGSPVSLLSVLYCNRGAALHGAGHYIEAMGDVSTALSLNRTYVKAYLRLAQMHIETHNGAAASEALRECDERKLQMSRQETDSFRSLKEQASRTAGTYRKVDAYRLLGLSSRCQTADVKKVFKKLALRLHPDKASHSVKLKLTWMNVVTEFVQTTEKQLRSRLHDHMQHLFKQLNSAHTILCDPTERRKLDQALQRTAYEGFSRYSHSSRRRDYAYWTENASYNNWF